MRTHISRHIYLLLQHSVITYSSLPIYSLFNAVRRALLRARARENTCIHDPSQISFLRHTYYFSRGTFERSTLRGFDVCVKAIRTSPARFQFNTRHICAHAYIHIGIVCI